MTNCLTLTRSHLRCSVFLPFARLTRPILYISFLLYVAIIRPLSLFFLILFLFPVAMISSEFEDQLKAVLFVSFLSYNSVTRFQTHIYQTYPTLIHINSICLFSPKENLRKLSRKLSRKLTKALPHRANVDKRRKLYKTHDKRTTM